MIDNRMANANQLWLDYFNQRLVADIGWNNDKNVWLILSGPNQRVEKNLEKIKSTVDLDNDEKVKMRQIAIPLAIDKFFIFAKDKISRLIQVGLLVDFFKLV